MGTELIVNTFSPAGFDYAVHQRPFKLWDMKYPMHGPWRLYFRTREEKDEYIAQFPSGWRKLRVSTLQQMEREVWGLSRK